MTAGTMHYLNETHIFIFLVQVFVILLLTRGLGSIFQKWGQPVLTAELLIGVLLGPTILGRFFPSIHTALFPSGAIQQAMLDTVAWFGVLFLLMSSGLEIDFSVAWRQKGKALTIALADIIIPMIVAFLPCLLLSEKYLIDPGQRFYFSLFMAVVMTISAMPVAARILHDLRLLKADIGFLIMSALAVNDIIGWVLFTIVLGLFTRTSVNIGLIFVVFAGTVGFAALALFAGPRISKRALDYLHKRGLPEPETSLTFACLLGLMLGAFTQKIGIHALFGFFIAGVVMGEAKNLSEQTRGIISQMVLAIFVPLFFANIGLKIDFIANFDLFLVMFMCLIGIAGRYFGAWVGVRLAKVLPADRNLISIAHIPGGMMEVVVAVLALENGLITSVVFVAIVFSAVFSSVIMGPWMRWAMKRKAPARLIDFLFPELLIPDLPAQDRAEAIRELSGKVALRAGLSGEQVREAVIAREEEFSTAVGYGVAIPHLRLESIKAPVVAVVRALHGLDWNAPDGQPVSRIFFILAPSGSKDIHLQLLAEIAGVMQIPENQNSFDSSDASRFRRTIIEIFAGNNNAANHH